MNVYIFFCQKGQVPYSHQWAVALHASQTEPELLRNIHRKRICYCNGLSDFIVLYFWFSCCCFFLLGINTINRRRPRESPNRKLRPQLFFRRQ
jgi:hypothetical protein